MDFWRRSITPRLAHRVCVSVEFLSGQRCELPVHYKGKRLSCGYRAGLSFASKTSSSRPRRISGFGHRLTNAQLLNRTQSNQASIAELLINFGAASLELNVMFSGTPNNLCESVKSVDQLPDHEYAHYHRQPPTTKSPTSPSPTGAARKSTIAEQEMPGLMSIREKYAAEKPLAGRAHHRLAAHDDPDRGAHRDARRARRRRALGELQHLLDPGSRRRGHRRGRRAGLRLEGRDARGILGLHLEGDREHRRQRPAARRR